VEQVPDVSYVRSGEVAIAYQVVGEGPEDLVLLPFLANIYTLWLLPPMVELFRRLAERRRLIVVNPRGVGLSDRPRGFTIESRMDDIRAVMDATASERAALLGIGESAATCAVFAASYPERVSRLLLFLPYARGAASEEERERGLEQIRLQRDRWGRRDQLEEMALRMNPDWSDDPAYLEWFVCTTA
jgi:pimeloyl-ACP methyl ester carboxylesterase